MADVDRTLQERLVALERRFWTEGAEFYREHLAEECLMIFAPTILGRDQIIAGVEGGTRWDEVEMGDVRLLPLREDVAVLAYSARGRRGGAPPYDALVSSTYVERDGRWLLAFHQQSPMPSA